MDNDQGHTFSWIVTGESLPEVVDILLGTVSATTAALLDEARGRKDYGLAAIGLIGASSPGHDCCFPVHLPIVALIYFYVLTCF